MKTVKLDERIKKVLAGVFGVSVEQITESSSPDTIEKWDSLHHMNLIIALEEEFAVEFSDEEVVELMNYEMIRLILTEKVQE